MKNHTVKRILKSSFLIFAFLTIIFAFLAIIDYSLILGWIVGSLASIIGFYLTSYMILSITKKSSWIKGFWVGMGKTWFQLFFHTIVLLAVIAINTKVSNARFFQSGFAAIIKPINFYTYLAGISIISVSALISELIMKGKRNGKL